MGTLKSRSQELESVILTVHDHLNSLNDQITKNFENKAHALNVVDLLRENILEVDRIIKESKAVFYRFVPLNEPLFKDEEKKTFRDLHHQLDNLIYVCFYAIEDLKDEINGTASVSSIGKTLTTFINNIDRIKVISTKMQNVGCRYVDPNKELFDIDENLKDKNKTIKILVVDDEPAVQHYSKKFLEKKGYIFFSSSTVAEAIKNIKENSPNIVLLDLNLQTNMDGVEVLKFIKEHNLPIKCIVISVVDNDFQVDIVKSYNPVRIFTKPLLDFNQLFAQINALVGNDK